MGLPKPPTVQSLATTETARKEAKQSLASFLTCNVSSLHLLILLDDWKRGDCKVIHNIRIGIIFLIAGLMGMLLILAACGDATQTSSGPSSLTSAPLPTVTPAGNGPTPMLGLATTTPGAPAVANTSTVPAAVATTNAPIVAVPPTPVPAPVIIRQPAPPVNAAPPNKDGGDNKGDNKDNGKGNDNGGKKPKK